MATTLDERRQKPTPRPAAAMDLGSVDGAAPLNLTPPGTMRPDTPAPVPTQPAPQFTRTNAGPMLAQPPAAPVAPAVDPQQQRLANQTAMYVQGAQAAAAQRPASPVPAATALVAPPAAPRAAPMKQAAYAGVNTMNQRAYAESEARKTAANPTGSIYGMGRASEVLTQPSQPLDAQAAADAKMFGRAWDATKDGFQRAGAAIADVATLPVRAAAGAYDTAVIRPMRAAGIPAGYMSPMVNPASNADGRSMTPFYDQFRARDEMAQKATDYGNEGRRTPMPAVPAAATAVAQGQRGTLEAQAKNPASDQGQVPGAAKPMPQSAQPEVGPPSGYTNTRVDGVYRKGNTFTDEAGTRDTAFQNRGPVSAQNMQAADQLAANYNSNQQALARFQAANPAPQPAQAAAPRQFDRAASIKAMTDLTSPEYRALRALRMEAESEAKANARLGRAGRGNNGAAQAYAALIAELTGGTRQGQVAEMQDGTNRYTADRREEGATQRALIGEEGATRRAGMTNDLAADRLEMDKEQASINIQKARQLQKAQEEYLNETDPAKREAKARTLQALMGKGDGVPAGKDRYITMGGGQEYDPKGGLINRPQEVFDTVTGQRVGAPAAPAQLPPKDKLVKGVVYDTPKGRGTWDGKNFIPVQQ